MKSKISKMAALAAALFIASLAQAGATVNVKDLGAAGDGKTLDTDAIQRAIDQCAATGGGTVNVPEGQFLVATVQLKDNVTLHLDDKAELIGTTDITAYRNVDPFRDGLGADVGWALLVAVDAKNIAIQGGGTINGQGREIAAGNKFKGQGWGNRPFLVRLVRCNGVSIKDVTLRDAGSWTTNLFQTDNVTIENVKINSHVAPHNDGFDIDGCQHVRITNCDVESGDDAICFKTTSTRAVKDITVSGCRLKSNQGAIKFGTESMANFEDVHISNCQMRDTRNGGIKLLTVDGSHLQNITVTDVTMENVQTPIFMRLGARLKTFRAGDTRNDVGSLTNVVIKNIKARSAVVKLTDKAAIVPPTGIYVIGIPGHSIEGLTLENIAIHLQGGASAEDARAEVEEKLDSYPEINRFGKTLPAYGMFARHVKGLTLNNVKFTLDAPDLRPAIVCNDAEGVKLTDLQFPTNAAAESLVRLESVKTASLPAAAGEVRSPNFVRIEGESADIRME